MVVSQLIIHFYNRECYFFPINKLNLFLTIEKENKNKLSKRAEVVSSDKGLDQHDPGFSPQYFKRTTNQNTVVIN